ncbi:MAG: diguanylate cyclase [Planctomycetales bacterium]|nr:diguanylate cyclase [Planctomycetales bacterium]
MVSSTVLESVLDLLPQAILVIDGADVIVHANQPAADELGYGANGLVGVSVHQLGEPGASLALPAPAETTECVLARQDGSSWQCQLECHRAGHEGGDLRILIATSRETCSAHLDPLTGIPHRQRLDERMRQLQAEGAEAVGCFFLDLDKFKDVNDQFGHLAGDQVLSHLAKRVVRCFRPGDTVVRFGGDEFLALVSPCDNLAARSICDRLDATLRGPVECGGRQIVVSASIGFAIGSPTRALIDSADRAMYAVKTAC